MYMRSETMLAALLFWAVIVPSGAFAQPAPANRPTTPELAQTVAGGNDWVTYGGALNNQRYSTLDQINTGNVANLKGAWLTRLGSGRGSKYIFEADPIVVDGVMYVPTGNDDIFALDATNGRKLWEWASDIPQVNSGICCGWDNRGVAVAEGKVFTGLLDGSFVAIDQKTGRTVWRTQLEDYHDGYSITGAFRYYDGMVFTGMSGADYGNRGRLYALDSATGRVLWRFYTIPAPGEFGSDTWPAPSDLDPVKAQAWIHGGATVWQAPAIDPDLGLLYFSTGNAGPDYDGSVRPGDNLFSASILALDYRTGQYKWHFQEVHHDIWDFDAPSPTVLFDQMYNGVMRKGIYQCGKTGWCYLLDRANGTPLLGVAEVPVAQEPRQATSPTQPRPEGDPFVPLCAEPRPDFPMAGCNMDGFWDVPVLMPSSASNFNPTSYDPQTGYLYVMGNVTLTARARKFEEWQPGKFWLASASVTPPGAPIKNTLSAIDTRTNKIVWQNTRDGNTSYGAVSTAGGVVFVGQIDGNLVGLDARTGGELWKFQTGWGISAPPMTYSVNGRQFVAVVSGGNRGGVTTLDGDAVWAFELNGTVDEVPAPPPIQTKSSVGGPTIHIGDPIGPATQVGGERMFDGTVVADDYFFVPVNIGIPVGTTLIWSNNGSVAHTATASGGAWDTGEIPGGQSASITFNTPGTYNYACTPHPWMLGVITVQ